MEEPFYLVLDPIDVLLTEIALKKREIDDLEGIKGRYQALFHNHTIHTHKRKHEKSHIPIKTSRLRGYKIDIGDIHYVSTFFQILYR